MVSLAAAAFAASTSSATVGSAVDRDPVVVLDGTTVAFDRPPVVRERRVFVPLRGVFERFGASVAYRGGHVEAVAGPHTIALGVCEATASVDGVTQTLHGPRCMIGGRTLVPLRFIAQAFGATVRFEPTKRIVTMTQARRSQAPPVPPLPPPLPASQPLPSPSFEGSADKLPSRGTPPVTAPSTRDATTSGVLIVMRLLRLEPASDATVARKRPEVSATFSETIDRRGTRISLDGRDVTAQTYLSERSFVFDPSFELAPGAHDVVVDGQTPARESFRSTWSFTTSDAVNSNYLSGLEPSNGATVGGANLELSGFTHSKARVRAIATTSETIPTFSAATEGSSTTDAVANGKGFFSLSLPIVERGTALLDVRVVSTAPDGTLAVRTLRLRR